VTLVVIAAVPIREYMKAIRSPPRLAPEKSDDFRPSAKDSMPDNNAAECGIRPIGVGRRNWLFAGSDTGGETLARAMTIIETAKMNGLDSQAYLADVLESIHDHKINRLVELLPWNWAPATQSHSQAA
jgi:hypothetical protein